jgi:protein tyrosine phosphatase
MNDKVIMKHLEDIKNFMALIEVFYNNGNLNRLLRYHNCIIKIIKQIKKEFAGIEKTNLHEVRIARTSLNTVRTTIKEYAALSFQEGINIADFDDFYESASVQLKAYENEILCKLMNGSGWMF